MGGVGVGLPDNFQLDRIAGGGFCFEVEKNSTKQRLD